MTTTPTLWGSEITFTFDPLAFGPKVTALSDGTFILAWENGEDIFGRHLNELGSFTGGDFLSAVSSSIIKPISAPIITEQSDGRVVVNYRLLFDDSPQDFDVFWHSPNDTFTPHSSVFGTENSGFDEILLDSTAREGGGGAIIYNYTGPGNVSNLVLRFTDSIGQQASNQIFIDSSATRLEQNPALTGLHTGFVAVAYESVLTSGAFPRDIRLKVYTPAEANVSGDVIVSATNVGASFPDITELQDGSFVVTWQQNGGIGFRRYIGNGVPIDATPQLIPGSSGGFLPKITPLNDNGFMVAWTEINGTESDGSPELDIFLQRYDVSGNVVGSTIHLDKLGDQGLAGLDIATLADGRVVLSYQSETGNATNLTTLNYQIFDPRDNIINATNGDDNFVSREDGASIFGFLGNDKLTGRADVDSLYGNQGNDNLFGAFGNDFLRGGSGDDILKGGAGLDFIRGGTGADSLTGGSQADLFFFKSIDESTVLPIGRDTIFDFKRVEGDIINVRQIDANINKGGNQNFEFIGDDRFNNEAGELRFNHKNGNTLVNADVDGDGDADFSVLVIGEINFKGADFHL
jgi:Ca2+-binding RTX toxin-like protein